MKCVRIYSTDEITTDVHTRIRTTHYYQGKSPISCSMPRVAVAVRLLLQSVKNRSEKILRQPLSSILFTTSADMKDSGVLLLLLTGPAPNNGVVD